MVNCNVTQMKLQPVSKWAGGSTTELFIYPPESKYINRDFEIRISSAVIDIFQSDFTTLPGYHRHLMPLNNTILLKHKNHHAVSLAPFMTDSFNGGWKTQCFGTCIDFNLMHTNQWKGSICKLESNANIHCVDGLTGLYLLSEEAIICVSRNGHKIYSHGLLKHDFLTIQLDQKKTDGVSLTVTGQKTPEAILVYAERSGHDTNFIFNYLNTI